MKSLPRVLAVFGAVALLASLASAYASRALFNPDQFANRASAALEDRAVADEVGIRVANELVGAEPDLIAVRPALEGVTSSVVRGGAFQGVFRAGVRDLHRAFFDFDRNTLTLTLVDIGATVSGALQAFDPKLAARVPGAADVQIVDGDVPDWAASLLQVADAASWVPWSLLGVAILAVGLAVAVASDRRVSLLALGVSMMIAAVLGVVGMRAGEALLLSSIDDQAGRDAASGVWNAFLGDLGTGFLLFAACGAVIAAAASSLLSPVDLEARGRRAWEFVVRPPEHTGARVGRAVALVAVGVMIILNTTAFVSILATITGLAVAYLGVGELMVLTTRPSVATGQTGGRRTLVAAGFSGLAILGAGAVFIGAGGISQDSLALETVGCNGSRDICDRPYDDVAIAATHNSMSAASYPNWLFAQQERGIADQLRAGVRGLLIDAHYGVETKDGTIKTDLSGLDRGERATYEDALGISALDAALRVRDRIVGSPEVGEPGVYLCHRFCELGAISLDRGFEEITKFVSANPDEVITVVIEDYVLPHEIAGAAERTGLDAHVYEGPVGDPWPTMQEILDSGGNVVMMAENDAGGEEIPWYHPAYKSLVQETPYSFSEPSQLTDPAKLPASCEPNRGRVSAGVFLVNHWIDTSPAPRPKSAAIVNTRPALLSRIHRCESQRGLIANLIAIDFYKEGDVVGAVAELNAER